MAAEKVSNERREKNQCLPFVFRAMLKDRIDKIGFTAKESRAGYGVQRKRH
jgi:hypothetical protein